MRAGPIDNGFVRPPAPATVLAFECCDSCDGEGSWEEESCNWCGYTTHECTRCDGTGEALIECEIAGEERIDDALEALQ